MINIQREYAPPELAMRFAEKLINGYDEDPDITWILQHTGKQLDSYIHAFSFIDAHLYNYSTIIKYTYYHQQRFISLYMSIRMVDT